ncbi:methyltransferase [Pseudaeromonas paramecii]|uniref:Ribosomal RNA large subunit methyltransferase G n=1 Tax=Pseudaeromonas paramecii TaxID=2138166 RepID=A0ABP8QC37_9GAMM
MSLMELAGQPWRLERYPPGGDPSLQAWEAADEYLMQALAEAPLPAGPLLIFNDGFGALSCWLHAHSPISISDSYLAQQACQQNWHSNGLDEAQLHQQDSLAPLPDEPGCVLFKIPKTLALLEYQLAALRRVVTPATRILAAAKARDIHSSTLALFERYLGPTRTSLAWKKARLIRCELDPALAPQAAPYPTVWPLEETNYQILNHANVFSRGSLDIGARFFLAHLPGNRLGTIADLGCGNGVLGLMALARNPEAKLLFVDESHMALSSARQNVEANRPQDLARCEFRLGNCLAGVDSSSLATVLCNPPFHQQQAITDHIAEQMIRDAHRCLAKGGELWLIGNRHLGYHHRLKKHFGRVETVASHPKFVLLRAIKP